MRIVHIGHGRIPIPPEASGAVEAIITDYGFYSQKFGHEFKAINDLSPAQSMMEAEAFKPDVVHLHDETKLDAFAVLNAPVKIVTTHDPTFFEKPNPFIQRFSRGQFLVGCLSDRQRIGFLMSGVSQKRLIDTPNGARQDLIYFSESPTWSNAMICLGMIGLRKRQQLLFDFPFVQCVGPLSAYDSVDTDGRQFEEWTKKQVHNHLTDYSALVLLSKSEAAPLVVTEALMAGLDVVVSEAAAANLDRSQPFVHVLDERTIPWPCGDFVSLLLLKMLVSLPALPVVGHHLHVFNCKLLPFAIASALMVALAVVKPIVTLLPVATLPVDM